jgi:signal transduction histidine kinase
MTSSALTEPSVRARIVEAADAERQRLERNLHDGAQQRLTALSLRLGLLATRVEPDSEVGRLLAAAREDLADSVNELRELARGLHPAVLSTCGLEAAVESVVARSPLPVTLAAEVGQRSPAPVEVAAYYVVCEALTNVAKYAGAASAAVTIVRQGRRLVVEVIDDGAGGADPEGGSGLRGLADRVEALGGRLRVSSPRGGGTTVHAEIPCAPIGLSAQSTF